MVQYRDPITGALIDPSDLRAFEAKLEIRAPGRTLPAGSILFLTEAAAHPLGDGVRPLRELPPDPALMPPPPPAPKISRPRSGKTKGGSAGGEAGDGRTTRKS